MAVSGGERKRSRGDAAAQDSLQARQQAGPQAKRADRDRRGTHTARRGPSFVALSLSLARGVLAVPSERATASLLELRCDAWAGRREFAAVAALGCCRRQDQD
jgi:hypothetical protein